jgi:acetyl-CoA carboxylase biotin carboxyl carrier protein
MDRIVSGNLARDLEILTDLFKAGNWRELRVRSDTLGLYFSLDPAAGGLDARPTATLAATAQPGSIAAAPAVAPPPPARGGSIDPSWQAVTAPNLGTFYRSPKPGAPAFVEVGQRVDANTEICLLEVMKLFTSVKAGINGVIVQVAATDAELVEGGQVLFYIQAD